MMIILLITTVLVVVSLILMYSAGRRRNKRVERGVFSIAIIIIVLMLNAIGLHLGNGIPAIMTAGALYDLERGIFYKRGESMKWEDGFAVTIEKYNCANDCKPRIYFMKKVPPEVFVRVGGENYAVAEEPAPITEESTVASDSVD